MMRRSLVRAGLAFGALVLAAVLILWIARFSIASHVVDRRLAAAGVPASYRLTRIGPFLERVENLRIGDPAAPDLIARRIDVMIGYDLGGPSVRAIRADGVRLRARIDPAGLSLGAIDRLLPRSSGGAAELPDIATRLRDVQIALATPNGAIRTTIAGDGNPRRHFQGTALASAARLRIASCALDTVSATMAIATDAGRPDATGPVRIARIACPHLTLGAGTSRIALSSDRTFRHLTAQAGLDGFGGSAGPARFVRVAGTVSATGMLGALDLSAQLKATSLALPAAATAVAASGASLAATPLGPVAVRARGAVAGLLRDADAQADLTAAIRGYRADLHFGTIVLADRAVGRLRVTERGGLIWGPDGWRADADIASGGGALPELTLRLRQAAPGAPVIGTGQLAPYRAGAAMLATGPLRFVWNDGRATFATNVVIDGPFDGGFVHGLDVPLTGSATAAGAVMIGPGCETIAFRQVQLAAFVFDAARLPLCGQPIVRRGVGGALAIDATTRPLRLAGHDGAGAPVVLAAAALHVTQAGFAADHVAAALGAPDRQTHLAVATLDGAMRNDGFGGAFAGAAGAIANVPLDLAEIGGTWRFEKGTLRLGGGLRVSDAGASERFHPLVTEDAALALESGAIHATATLLEPTTRAKVAQVVLDHDLSRGAGHALLAMPALAFTLKGLQPDKLTPLTLGVIANVVGTVAGSGRIGWDAQGVTSSGTFGTDRIDLAAAFGPVNGIKGQVHFTDLLGLVSAPHQEATIAEINPGVAVGNVVVHYQLAGQNRLAIEDASWPFASGTLRLEPTILDFGGGADRRLVFRIDGLDAAAFVQQLDFPNIAATGTFDGELPILFDQTGGRIAGGAIVARPGGGTLAYVGELSSAELGAMGKLAFDALKAIRYSSLDIALDGRLDGEMVSRVRFTGVREATPEQSLVTRLIRNLPFRFNIAIRAPFRGLVGSARAYIDPRLLLSQPGLLSATPAESAVQPPASGGVR